MSNFDSDQSALSIESLEGEILALTKINKKLDKLKEEEKKKKDHKIR